MNKKQQKMNQTQAMSLLIQVVYWCFFIIVALFIQFFIPGVDIMLVGLLIIIPERKILQTILLFCIFIILQEATGILTFGLLLLEYSVLILSFFIGRTIFAVGTFSFVFLLSLFISFVYFVLIQIFGALQGIYVSPTSVMYDSILQALLVPLVWYPMQHLYGRYVRRGNTI